MCTYVGVWIQVVKEVAFWMVGQLVLCGKKNTFTS